MDQKSILLFTISIVAVSLSLISSRGKRNGQEIYFSLFTLCTGLWSFGLGIFNLDLSLQISIASIKFYYVAAAGIAFFFLLFAFNFPAKHRLHSAVLALGLIGFLLISYEVLFNNSFIIQNISIGDFKKIVLNRPTYFIYISYFICYIIAAYSKLLFSFYTCKKDSLERIQLKFILLATIVPFLLGMFFNLILPIYTYEYIWAGPIFLALFIWTIVYGIYKHKLLNAQVLATEIFIFALWIFLLLRAITGNDFQAKIADIGLLISSVVIGVLLVKSVRNQVQQRERLEKLSLDLEQANVHLKELDQQKSEFVSLASHQLRGPLTAVKGYASMLLDGDFGEVKDGVKDSIEKIYKSTQDLVVLVGDYLDVSRIEQGRMQYDFTQFDLRALVGTVVAELRPTIEKAKLNIEYSYDQNQDFSVNADIGKIKQVIGNLIDNAIKYTPKGAIHVWLTRNAPGKLLISISDTGVGIPPEVLPRLFEKFTRAPDASKTNIMGTGLGLYVAKKMIEAHDGKVWAESPGQGKGTTFFIELSAA